MSEHFFINVDAINGWRVRDCGGLISSSNSNGWSGCSGCSGSKVCEGDWIVAEFEASACEWRILFFGVPIIFLRGCRRLVTWRQILWSVRGNCCPCGAMVGYLFKRGECYKCSVFKEGAIFLNETPSWWAPL